MKYQSNALWAAAEALCVSPYGDNISTDTHDTFEQAIGVCKGLERHGFGGDGKVFPLRTWVSPVQQPPRFPARSGDGGEGKA